MAESAAESGPDARVCDSCGVVSPKPHLDHCQKPSGGPCSQCGVLFATAGEYNAHLKACISAATPPDPRLRVGVVFDPSRQSVTLEFDPKEVQTFQMLQMILNGAVQEAEARSRLAQLAEMQQRANQRVQIAKAQQILQGGR